MVDETDPPRHGNRRLTSRRACLLTVHYRLADEWRPATAMNLSRHGCRLRVGEEVRPGVTIVVQFEAPLRDGASTPTAEVEGRVAWSRIEGLSRQVGVKFAARPPELDEILAVLS
jgi:PilZ domain